MGMLSSRAEFEAAFRGKPYVWHNAMEKLLGKTVEVVSAGAGTFTLPKSDPTSYFDHWYYPFSAIACVEVGDDEPPTYSPHSAGLALKSDEAAIKFGSKSDVSIKRTAGGKLAVDTAEMDVSGAVKAKKFYIDGVSLDDYIAAQVAKQVAKVLKQ